MTRHASGFAIPVGAGRAFRTWPRSILRDLARARTHGRHQRKAIARIARAKAKWGLR